MSKLAIANRTASRQRGVSLIEALIAMLVMALGMVGIAALQAKLRVNSDVAKQRSEAVRIAEEDLENFRAFGTLAGIGANGAIPNSFAYAGVTDDANKRVVTTNATYSINRSVVDHDPPPPAVNPDRARMKDLLVSVSWTDREGVPQSVALRSVIAGIDPLLAAALTIAPNGSPVRDALGRDIQIPIPAKNLGNGTSIFKPVANGTTAYVFNNDSGMITRKCTDIAADAYTAALTSASGTCTDINAMLLSGYVRTSLANSPNAATPNDPPPGALSIRLDLEDDDPPAGTKGTAAQLTAAFWPTAAEAVRLNGYTAPECAAEDSKTVRFTTPVNFTQLNNSVTQVVNSTTVIAIVPASVALSPAAIAPYAGLTAEQVIDPVATGERFIAYTCAVYPRTFAGALAWTGRSMLVPSGWTIGTGAGDYKVCRFSEDYNLNGHVWVESGGNVIKIENGEHPYAYLQANGGLQNQNFLIIRGNRSCPTDGAVEVDGTGGENYTDETTVIHQQ
jgi:type II secretory pathway pseudopilin PulG